MASQADQFNSELLGSGSLVDREYSRLLTKTGQPAGRYSLRDLYVMAEEEPRLILGRYSVTGPTEPTTWTIADSFDRTDDLTGLGTTDTGEIWIHEQNLWTVSSNGAVPSMPADTGARAYVEVPDLDYTAELTIVTPGEFTGLIFRKTDVGNELHIIGEFPNNKWGLYKVLGGVVTSVSSFTAPIAANDVVSVRVVGDNVLVSVNGVSVIEYLITDPILRTGTKVGIVDTYHNGVLPKVDNFNVASITPYVFTDDFNRADGALGSEWIQVVEPMTVVSNVAQSGATQRGHMRHATPLDSANHYAQAEMVGTLDGGVFVRGNKSTSSATFNGYFARYDDTSSNLSIYKFTGGAATALASLTQDMTFPITLRLEAEGSTIRCLVDGVEVLSATDSTYLSGLFVGMRVFNTSQRIDNFEAGSL